MKKTNILLVISIVFSIAAILSGCANSSLEQIELTTEGDKIVPESSENEEWTSQPEEELGETLIIETPNVELAPSEVPSEIMEEIISDLVERSSAENNKIDIIRAEAVVWNDGSLGCSKPGEVYIQMLINGYWVVFDVEGVEYDYRASDSGHFKLCEGASMHPITSPDTSDQTKNPLVIQAKEDLATRLGIQPSEIELLSYEEVVWPDSSLGCPQPGMKYLQVPQDGALIRLSAQDQVYNYHSGGNRGVFLCEQLYKDPNLPPKIDISDLTPQITNKNTPTNTTPDNSIPPGEDQ